jgi:hypothetical protein
MQPSQGSGIFFFFILSTRVHVIGASNKKSNLSNSHLDWCSRKQERNHTHKLTTQGNSSKAIVVEKEKHVRLLGLPDGIWPVEVSPSQKSKWTGARSLGSTSCLPPGQFTMGALCFFSFYRNKKPCYLFLKRNVLFLHSKYLNLLFK